MGNRSNTEDLATSSRTYPMHRRSLSSSSRGSRSWRRVDSSRLHSHTRTQSGSLYGGSPNSFTWNPLASTSGRIGDSMIAEPDLAASPSTTINSSKEDRFSSSPPTISNTPETTPFINAMNVPATRQTKPALPSSAQFNDSLLSKSTFLVPANPLRREFYDGRFPPAGPGRMSSLEGRRSFHRSGSSRSSSAGGSSDWSSLHGFSELGPHARQERLRWASATSPSDFSWGVSREGLNRSSGLLCVEKITAESSHSATASPRSENCGLCSRLLTQRSPWGASRVMGYHECNVVGVLVCGHTYHAECLEQITPDSSRQDPACPRCGSAEKIAPKETAVVEPTPQKVGNVLGSGLVNRTSSRNKLSRIGVFDDDLNMPESSFLIEEGRPRFPLTMPPSDPSFLSRSTSRRRFSFRNRFYRDSTNDGGWRKPGSSTRVSPDSSSDDLSPGGPLKRTKAMNHLPES